MSAIENALIVTFYVIFCLLGNFAAYIIQLYHELKPLGMQTLLDKTIRLLVLTFCISSTVWVLVAVIIQLSLTPLPYLVSLLLTLTGNVVLVYIHRQLFFHCYLVL